jgi:ACS family tartrate transporter-like MFS transporter
VGNSVDISLCATAVAKFRRKVLPFIFIIWILNSLDRANIGYAQLQMGVSLHISSAAYGLGAGMFFIGNALFCLPASLLVERVGVRRWLAAITAAWGTVACLMAFIEGPRSFYFLRFLLGIAEAGFIPALSFYIASWAPPQFRSRINAIFIVGLPVSLIIGGPLSGLMLKLSGPLYGWQWMFLLQGLPSVVMGLVLLRFLPEKPADASWLSVAERAALTGAMSEDAKGDGKVAPASWFSGFEVFRRGPIWALMVILLIAYSANFTMVFFFPTILKNLYGLDPLTIGELAVIPNLAAIVVTYFIGRSSEKFGDIRWHLAAIFVLGAIGFLLLEFFSRRPIVFFMFAATLITTYSIAYYAPFATALQNVIGTHAGPFGMVATLTCMGGFLGPMLTGKVMQANHGDWASVSEFLAGALLLAGVLSALYIRNAKRVGVGERNVRRMPIKPLPGQTDPVK